MSLNTNNNEGDITLYNHTEKVKKNILFVGDNTDTPNFGCRSTSEALSDILSRSFTIVDRLYRNEILKLFVNTPIYDDLCVYIDTVKDIDAKSYVSMLQRIENVDVVVLNGEGSFIFQSPPRADLHYYLVILSACIETKKPFYILNAMFTAFADEPLNISLLSQAIPILEHAEVFAARDLQSMSIIKEYGEKVNSIFIPDALFSWYIALGEKQDILRNQLANPKLVLPFTSNNHFYDSLDFSKPYALLSGNSYANWHYDKALESFTKLAIALKHHAEKIGISLFLIETCSGDSVLRQVASDTKLPLVTVDINIYLASYILGNAQCYVSGRYHPSIMASLGGTPCVFMGANSHKTLSLQTVLEIPPQEQLLFPAIPDDHAIQEIVVAFENAVSHQNRERVKKICKRNSTIVEREITALFKQTFEIQKLVIKTGTSCTLRCEKCGEFNPYLNDNEKTFNLTTERLLLDVSPIIASASYIKTVHIAGGEPFLHKDLIQLIFSLTEFPQVEQIEIVTNGTVMPCDMTLESLKNLGERVLVIVSDYSGAGVNNKDIIDVLEVYEINYIIQKDIVWKDKSNTDFKGYSNKELYELAQKCSIFRQSYYSLIDGVVTAHCPTAGSLLYYLGLYDEMENYYFNIRNVDEQELPKEFIKLNEQQYTPMCNYCVPSFLASNCEAGKQMEKSKLEEVKK